MWFMWAANGLDNLVEYSQNRGQDYLRMISGVQWQNQSFWTPPYLSRPYDKAFKGQ